MGCCLSSKINRRRVHSGLNVKLIVGDGNLRIGGGEMKHVNFLLELMGREYKFHKVAMGLNSGPAEFILASDERVAESVEKAYPCDGGLPSPVQAMMEMVLYMEKKDNRMEQENNDKGFDCLVDEVGGFGLVTVKSIGDCGPFAAIISTADCIVDLRDWLSCGNDDRLSFMMVHISGVMSERIHEAKRYRKLESKHDNGKYENRNVLLEILSGGIIDSGTGVCDSGYVKVTLAVECGLKEVVEKKFPKILDFTPCMIAALDALQYIDKTKAKYGQEDILFMQFTDQTVLSRLLWLSHWTEEGKQRCLFRINPMFGSFMIWRP